MNKFEVDIENPEELNQELTEPRTFEDWIYMDIGYGFDARREVHDMYMTVKRLNLEDFMKKYNGKTEDKRKEINKISDNLENNNHSCFSFSSCLWQTSIVYKNGWNPKYNVHSS
jgi:hypothetical protein